MIAYTKRVILFWFRLRGGVLERRRETFPTVSLRLFRWSFLRHPGSTVSTSFIGVCHESMIQQRPFFPAIWGSTRDQSSQCQNASSNKWYSNVQKTSKNGPQTSLPGPIQVTALCAGSISKRSGHGLWQSMMSMLNCTGVRTAVDLHTKTGTKSRLNAPFHGGTGAIGNGWESSVKAQRVSARRFSCRSSNIACVAWNRCENAPDPGVSQNAVSQPQIWTLLPPFCW